MSDRIVLYAEDDINDAFFMHMAFETLGLLHRFVCVHNGRKAIDYLAGRGPYADRVQHPLPSILLLDLNLPIKTGFDVLQWIREQPGLKDLKVVVVSASGQKADMELAKAMGAVDYVIKPSHPSALTEIVRAGLERWSK